MPGEITPAPAPTRGPTRPRPGRRRRCRAARRCHVQLHPRAPHRRGHRIGQLLQPRQMRQRAVVERLRRVGHEVERVLGRRRRRSAARPTAAARRLACVATRGGAASGRGSRGLQHLLVGLPRQRRFEWLLQPPRRRRAARRASRAWCRAAASPGPAVVATATAAPDSGCDSVHVSRNVWSGRIEIGQCARLVEEVPERHDEGHLGQRRGGLPGRRRRKQRIGLVEEQDRCRGRGGQHVAQRTRRRRHRRRRRHEGDAARARRRCRPAHSAR